MIKKLPNGIQLFKLNEPFHFELGGRIEQLSLAFELYGEMNSDKSNVILIHHALSTGSHVASHKLNRLAGWWEQLVGKGKAIDTEKYCVICINNIGGCYGSIGPSSVNVETNKPYLNTFPIFKFTDIVRSQKMLLDYLDIKKLYAVIGSSVGGMSSLQMNYDYPDITKKLLLISSCHKAYPANIANRHIQREVIQLDYSYKNGAYHISPQHGLKAARKLGFYTYRSPAEFNKRFEKKKISLEQVEMNSHLSEVENYLEYNASKFVKNFDTNSYMYFTKAMDLYDISSGESWKENLKKITTEHIKVISVETDLLFPPFQQQKTYEILKDIGLNVDYYEYSSIHGHDSFLIDNDIMTKQLTNFLN
jgi:homoserine O-acetyltransferase/O-succinyltransferase